jgi:hypothetical protein
MSEKPIAPGRIARKGTRKRGVDLKNLEIRDVSSVIHSRNHPFVIDATIRELRREKRLQKRWDKLDDAIAFGRRMLEAATIKALEAVEENKTDTINDHEQMAMLAQTAGDDLRRLLDHIASGTPANLKLKAIPLHTLLKKPLKQMYVRDGQLNGSILKIAPTRLRAGQDAVTLCNALEIMQWVEAYGRKNRDFVAGSFRNPGLPHKLAFARCVMEGWICLIGRKPSEGNESFKGFLSDAWSGVCGSKEDWRHSIREAGKAIPPHIVRNLISKGPDWT